MCESYLSGVILQEQGAENINEELLVWIKLLLKAGNPNFLKAYYNCVCVCVRERERDRERERQRERERERPTLDHKTSLKCTFF